MALDENIKAFVVYVNSLSLESRMIIYPAREIQIALLLANKVIVSAKYSDFTYVFPEKLANILSKQTKVNMHAIKLE